MIRKVLVRLPVVVPVVLIAALLAGRASGNDPLGADPLGLQCGDAAVGTTPNPVDARTRDAAQKGLDFLAADTVRWQDQQQCYGCHVQAVTLQAMAVGKHNQYSIEDKALQTVLKGITQLPGGSRTPDGLRYAHGTYYSAARSLGGAAFARYDAWVAADMRDDLKQTADQLYAMRDTNGAIINDYTNPPVAAGPMQDTVLAMQTWKQAYERTADDQWLTAVSSAETWVKATADGWTTGPDDIQQINYALLGFDAAGTGMTEPVVSKLVKELLARQATDGGWGLSPGAPSDPYATGQTLYVLRTLGVADTDPAIAAGTNWLVQNQQADGSWSHRGSQRAEAMWAVMGLVSVDVLSLAVTGISDGDRIDGIVPISADAFDNNGGRVVKVEMWVDDMPITGACGPHMQTSWDTGKVAIGRHLVDVRAVNEAGKVARRRIEVFTGPIYLTRLGTRWDDGGTLISLRNTAPDSLHGTVKLTIRTPDGKTVYTEDRNALQGPLNFFWNGKDNAGGQEPEGRYVAHFDFVKDGKILHSADTTFVHADPAAQAANYANVQGQIGFAEGGEAANTQVQLVDDSGAVVAETITTSNGQYLFKNVDAGKYKVRVTKDGRKAEEAPVVAAPAAPAAEADLDLEQQ